MGKKRPKPSEFVRAVAKRGSKCWFFKLPDADKKYVMEVVAEAAKFEDVSVTGISLALIEELEIDRHRSNVITKVSELIKEYIRGQKKT